MDAQSTILHVVYLYSLFCSVMYAEKVITKVRILNLVVLSLINLQNRQI